MHLFPAVAGPRLSVRTPWTPFPQTTLCMVNQFFHQSCGHGMGRFSLKPWWRLVGDWGSHLDIFSGTTVSRAHVQAAKLTNESQSINIDDGYLKNTSLKTVKENKSHVFLCICVCKTLHADLANDVYEF